MGSSLLKITMFCGILSVNLQAGDVKVAVSSNFATTLEKISEAFTKETGHKLVISSGATGKIYAQIREGAPFEVLLSADQTTPMKLITDNLAVEETQFTFAVGRLVLWSLKDKFVDDEGAVIKTSSVNHIAIANPKLAPYGVAAKEYLEKVGIWKIVEAKIVYGENISQTYQFVSTGNAEVGFIAMSQIMDTKGSYWVVPESQYSPLKHDVILLNKGKTNPIAKKFLEFLKDRKVKAIISKFGYKS
jgi:molybdate transport system substrate-binding protein